MSLQHIFPDHWSFLLGEMALYSFIILLLTGTFLTLFFKPSMTEVVYHGSYVKLDGIKMSEAYQSALNISFDVRGGLLIREIHHWAADLFVAAIAIHVLRIFFTGAFRKPREVNWLIGTVMFALAADLNIPVEYLVWFFRVGFFVLPALGFGVTRHICLALQRADRRKLREGTSYGLAMQEERACTAVSRPLSAEERAVLEAWQPEQLLTPTPRHLIPLPSPGRAAAQLRARLNHFYLRTRLEIPSARAGLDGGRPGSRRTSG
jgi:Cytochrome b(N-terminal)/b6/petB